jgi:hypothetical protein
MVELFEGAIVRCAGWPVEALDPFGSPKLVQLARETQELATSIQDRQKELSTQLYSHLLTAQTQNARRHLLETRRNIRSTTKALPSWCVSRLDLSHLPDRLLAALDEDHLQRVRLSELEKDLSQAYLEEATRERAALRQVAGSVEFQRALTLANPELAERWERYVKLPWDTSAYKATHLKKSREARMEAAVLFYLFRAAGRPTPGGLWAGIAPLIVRQDGDSNPSEPGWAVRPVARQFRVTVNLNPFARIVERLSQARYRSSPTVRLSPTAYRDGGLWRFQPTGVDKHDWQSFSPDRWSSLILQTFVDRRTCELESVINECAQLPGPLDADSARLSLSEAARRLLDCGLLISGLRFPESASGPWGALAQIAVQLTDADQMFWNSKIVGIRCICDELSDEISQSSPDKIRRACVRVESELRKLFSWAGLDEPLLGPMLLVDFQAGFEVACSPASWKAVQIAASEVLSFYQSHGAPDALRRLTLNALVGSERTNRLSFLDIARKRASILESSRAPCGPEAECLTRDLQDEVVGRQHRWYRELVSRSLQQTAITAPAAMFAKKPVAGFDGTIVFTISASGGMRAEWGRPHAFCLISRFTDLLNTTTHGAMLAESVRRWYASWERYGCRAAEIVGADPLNFNAAVRPSLTQCRVAPVGSDFVLAELFIESAPSGIRPWMRTDSTELRLIPVYNCTARIGVRDASSDVLYRLALAYGWEFFCRRLFPANVPANRIPRLLTPGGTVLSPTRWFLRREDLEDLLRLDELHRFMSWLRHAQRLGLPDRVRVVIGSEPESPLLSIPVTSPLAIRALLSKVARNPADLEIVEEHTECGDWLIKDAEGRHYSSEIVVGWKDPSYLSVEGCSVEGEGEE